MPAPKVKRAARDASMRNCMDCGKDTIDSQELYALKDPLWRRLNPLVIGMLCLGCAEDRLCRPLYRSDFAAYPINAQHARVCPALADRLSRARPRTSPPSAAHVAQLTSRRTEVMAKKGRTQSPLGRFSWALFQQRGHNGRVSRKAFAQVLQAQQALNASARTRKR
jgi:hypothetical protein